MKLKILHNVHLSKLLIVSYCGLLIFVALIRFAEYKQTRKAARKVNTISEITNQKLELLISINQNYVSEQKIIIRHIHIPDRGQTQADNQIAGSAMRGNKNNFSTYQKLIRTKIEKDVFNKLLLFDNVTRQMNDSLLQLVAENPLQKQKLQQLMEKKIDSYSDFNVINYELLNLVSKESEMEISNTNNYLILLAKRKELSSYLIILLLLVLGLSIGNTLRKLRRTENKYRLLFDLSPLPKYIVDPTDYRILSVNAAAVKLYGYNKKEFLNITIFDLRQIKEKKLENFMTKMQPFSQIGSSFTEKARHNKKNGDAIEVEINSHTIYLGKRKVILVTINDITEKEKQEKKTTEAIIKAQEDERRVLGSELHDNIGQILASAQLFLSMAMKTEYDKTKKYLAETRKYLTMAINETRNISHRVFPSFLEEITLPEAIINLLKDMNPGGSLMIRFEYDSRLLTKFISPDIKLNIYRILQEQLKNIQKYSKATESKIELRTTDNWIFLKITDNGIGFDLKKMKPGIGLINIKKRAELFSGKFMLDTAPQKGCSIEIAIPFINDKVA